MGGSSKRCLLEAASPQSDTNARPFLEAAAGRPGRETKAGSALLSLSHYPHYYDTTTPVGAVRAGDWKLLEYFEDNRLELYNLREDPLEQRNLAETARDEAEQLRARLHAWRKEVDARMPTPNPNNAIKN